MKISVLLISVALLANCGGSDLGNCDQPARLSLAISANPLILGQEALVVSQGVDNFCKSVPVGTPVHFFVNGYQYIFPKSGKDSIDTFTTQLGATTELVASSLLGEKAMLHATMVVDGEIIEATPIELGVTR